MTDALQMKFSAGSFQEFEASWERVLERQNADVSQSLSEILRHLMRSPTKSILEVFHGRTVDEVLNDAPIEEMERSRRLKDGWRTVRRIALEGRSAEIQTLACPRCGGGLRLSYDARSQQTDGQVAGLVRIQCTQCVSGSYVDDPSRTPVWVTELGATIVTSPPSGH